MLLLLSIFSEMVSLSIIIILIIIRFFFFFFWNLLPEFLQPQHIWPYIQQNFIHHHSQIHSQGFHVSLPLNRFSWGFALQFQLSNIYIAFESHQNQATNNNHQQNNFNNSQQEQQTQYNQQHVPSPISSNSEIDHPLNGNSNNKNNNVNNDGNSSNADTASITSDVQDSNNGQIVHHHQQQV